MQETFQIKRGDTSPFLRYALAPTTVSLTGASVRFKMQLAGRQGAVVDAPGVVVSQQPPIVGYLWAAGDTDQAGRYQAEFQVTYGDGHIETFPNQGFIAVSVNADVPGLA